MKYLKTYDEKCIGCNKCMTACAMSFFKVDDAVKSAIQVVARPEGGFHLVVCDQKYRKCVAECPTQAITINKQGVVMINKKLCIGCFACVAVCPIDAMRRCDGLENPFKCVACGVCVKACPTQAIEIVTEEE